MHKLTFPLSFLLLLLLLSASAQLSAQEGWTLERSINYALENNLTIRQAQLSQQNAELQLRGDQLSRLPSASASASVGAQFGRSINPVSNEFVTINTLFNSFSVGANVTVFAGGQINNSIKQSRISAQAAQLETQAAKNDIALFVASNYLNVLLAREQLQNARTRLRLSQEQLAQTDRLIEAGNLPGADRLDLVAQVALDQRSVVEAENLLANNLLALKQLLQLDITADFDIASPNVELENPLYGLDINELMLYQMAVDRLPTVEASRLRTESAAIGIELAKAGFYPSVNLSGGLGSNYATFLDAPTGVMDQGPYTDQLNENLNQNVRLGVNIPIYSNGRNRINVQRAEITRQQAQVQLQQTEQNLMSDVQQAVTNLRASQKAYVAAQESLDASEAAQENMSRRFELGTANILDLTTTANRLDQARTELTRAKYQLIFNQKVIDFYQGRPLRLN